MTAPPLACPVCGKPAEAVYRPFCSRRCADVDLGRWFNEDYRIPADKPDEEPDGEPNGESVGNPAGEPGEDRGGPPGARSGDDRRGALAH